MKSVVIYFSQTGNTEKVAKAIHVGMKRVTNKCDLLTIKDANPHRLNEYDLIGLGSPVFGVEPANFRIFINNLRYIGGKHAFAFCTHGTHGELFFPRVVPMLKRKGLIVIGTRDWYGSISITCMPRPYPTDGHPDEIDLREAEDFGQDMVEKSQKITAGEIELIPPTPRRPSTERKELDPTMSKIRYADLLKFHEEKCAYPKCKLCMENCPLDAIDLTITPPLIANPCEDCGFCAKICPTGALDDEEFSEIQWKRSEKDIKDFLLIELKKAEEEGRFRWLVPKEKIGTGIPLYKMHKHPQLIIRKK